MINFSVFGVSLIMSFIICFFYKKIWNFKFNGIKIPTGFGILLSVFLLVYAVIFELSIFLYISIFILSFIYWIDDIKSLPATVRFFLQFFLGAIISILALESSSIQFGYEYILFVIISGIFNIFLTNIFNFYDGLDLNLSTLIILFALTILFAFSKDKNLVPQAYLIIGFILGFSFFNFKSNNIFFGDAGCFIVGSYCTYIITNSYLLGDFNFLYFASFLALPCFDVFYVVLLRLYMKENLLTRNYHHLYHKSYYYFKNKSYLLNQLINAILIILCHLVIRNGDISDEYSFLISSILVTPIFYFVFRKIVIKEK